MRIIGWHGQTLFVRACARIYIAYPCQRLNCAAPTGLKYGYFSYPPLTQWATIVLPLTGHSIRIASAIQTFRITTWDIFEKMRSSKGKAKASPYVLLPAGSQSNAPRFLPVNNAPFDIVNSDTVLPRCRFRGCPCG